MFDGSRRADGIISYSTSLKQIVLLNLEVDSVSVTCWKDRVFSPASFPDVEALDVKPNITDTQIKLVNSDFSGGRIDRCDRNS